MYSQDAINYGLDRDGFVSNLDLSNEERQMLAEIDQHLLPTGYYDVKKFGGSTLDSFFGSSNVDNVFTAEKNAAKSPELLLAEKIDAAWDKAVAEAEENAEDAEFTEGVTNAYKRIVDGNHTNADLDTMVTAGIARRVYGDPESERPTGIEWIEKPDGDPYADQVGIEEKPTLGRR